MPRADLHVLAHLQAHSGVGLDLPALVWEITDDTAFAHVASCAEAPLISAFPPGVLPGETTTPFGLRELEASAASCCWMRVRADFPHPAAAFLPLLLGALHTLELVGESAASAESYAATLDADPAGWILVSTAAAVEAAESDAEHSLAPRLDALAAVGVPASLCAYLETLTATTLAPARLARELLAPLQDAGAVLPALCALPACPGDPIPALVGLRLGDEFQYAGPYGAERTALERFLARSEILLPAQVTLVAAAPPLALLRAPWCLLENHPPEGTEEVALLPESGHAEELLAECLQLASLIEAPLPEAWAAACDALEGSHSPTHH